MRQQAFLFRWTGDVVKAAVCFYHPMLAITAKIIIVVGVMCCRLSATDSSSILSVINIEAVTRLKPTTAATTVMFEVWTTSGRRQTREIAAATRRDGHPMWALVWAKTSCRRHICSTLACGRYDNLPFFSLKISIEVKYCKCQNIKAGNLRRTEKLVISWLEMTFAL